jgi:hypothetical protein
MKPKESTEHQTISKRLRDGMLLPGVQVSRGSTCNCAREALPSLQSNRQVSGQ